ncbi:MAG: threonine synthase [Anaerolineales bacterium]
MQILCSDCSREVLPQTLGLCSTCGGILRPYYPGEAVSHLTHIHPGPGIDRYRSLLPVATALPFLGEGDTPLIRSRRLGPSLGLRRLYFKYEGRHPSGAFKDRAAAVAATLAQESGAEGVLTASSGNAAAAISAYSAAVGSPCLILLEPGNPPAKIRQALATGARVLPVEGIFAHGPDALRDLLIQVAEQLNYYLAFVWAPVNPYLLEGLKTISYEVAARLPGAPDVVLCPVGGGDLFTAQWRGYLELKRAGVIEQLPRLIAVQSAAAAPLLRAFESGAEQVALLPEASSQISGINVAFTGDHALAAVRESQGLVVGVSDEEILAMQRRLSREEGIWAEPAAAAPLAAIPGLMAQGQLQADERVVCILTGSGFKDAHLAEAEAAQVMQRKPAPFEAGGIVGQAKH